MDKQEGSAWCFTYYAEGSTSTKVPLTAKGHKHECFPHSSARQHGLLHYPTCFIQMEKPTGVINTDQTAHNLSDLQPLTYYSAFTKLEGAQLLPVMHKL
jgi:hypothetical protein